VPVLERSFYKVYGQELGSIFSNINSAINTMRWGVRNLFPVLTKSAYNANKKEIQAMQPDMTVKKFRYKMSRRAFNLQYGKERQEPKFFAKVAVFFIRILPKIGPLKTLKFKSPGAEGEKLFANSFETILANYHTALVQAGKKQLVLPDINFDTGDPTRLGEYELTDETYATLIQKLQNQGYKDVTPQLQKNILQYYSGADTSRFLADKPEQKEKIKAAIKQIQNLQPLPQDNMRSLIEE
jgi:hypothetical protein